MKIDSERLPTVGPEGFWTWLTPRFLRPKGIVIPVLRLSGTIGGGTPFRSGLSIAGCANAIERAFSVKGAPAVALQINSPGGSPVQSRLIYDRIRTLAAEKSKKVFAFAEDVAASGGYMIACAADEIYADGASVVGSIGVLSAGFGFVDLIQRYGIERRVYTSGENKFQLDPFKPENPEEVERLKRIQEIVHEDFIALVKESRGARIAEAGKALFTGEFWSGRQAVSLGLVDGISDVRTKMRALYGENVRLKLIATERGFLRRRQVPGIAMWESGRNASFMQGLTADILATLEERALWARFGF